jgi:hypothetical protein
MSAIESAEAFSRGVDMGALPWARAGVANERDRSVAVSSFMGFDSFMFGFTG